MSKPVAFRGMALYLFICGIVALVLVPFLPWFYYGLNFEFPSQVSLIYLFEWQSARTTSIFLLLESQLVLYLLGVGAAVVVAALARRPVLFHGMLSGAFPLYIFALVVANPYMPHVLTAGISTAFAGSALLEASYFLYRTSRKLGQLPR